MLNHRPGPPSMSCIWERWGSDSSANHWNMYMYMQKSHQNESDWSHHWSCLCQLYMLSAGSTPPQSQWQLWWPCKKWCWEGVPRPPDQTPHAWRQLHAGSGQWTCLADLHSKSLKFQPRVNMTNWLNGCRPPHLLGGCPLLQVFPGHPECCHIWQQMHPAGCGPKASQGFSPPTLFWTEKDATALTGCSLCNNKHIHDVIWPLLRFITNESLSNSKIENIGWCITVFLRTYHFQKVVVSWLQSIKLSIHRFREHP